MLGARSRRHKSVSWFQETPHRPGVFTTLLEYLSTPVRTCSRRLLTVVMRLAYRDPL